MIAPHDIAARIARDRPDFRSAAAFRADVTRDGLLQDEWLVAGADAIARIDDGGVTWMTSADAAALATQPYLSGGRITARRGADSVLLARYTGERTADAEAFVDAANRLLQLPHPAQGGGDSTPAEADGGTGADAGAQAGDGGDASAAPDPRRMLPRLVALMPRSKYWRLPVFCVALAGGAAAAVVAPFLAGRFLFDEVLSPQGRFAGMVLLAVGLILLARLAEVGFRITWGWVNAAFIHDLEITLKRTAFHSLQRLSMRFHTARHSGELMTRLEQDASDVALLFHIIAPSALHGGIFLAGALAAMLLLDWQLAIAAILPFPVLLIAFRRILPEVNSYFDRLFRAEAALRTVTTDTVTGARVVRAFGGQRRELARFAAPNREAARLGYLAEAMTGTTRPPMELVTELVLVGVWAAGAWAVARDQVTIGLVVTFAGYLSRFFWPVGGLVDLAEEWGRVATAARRLLALIDARPDLPEARQPRRISGTRAGGLALERVSFSYERGQPALREVSLHAAPGELIGLVGPTGAGKSTVINLLARLYDADTGVVRVAGHDVRDLSGADLATQLGVVLQDTYLFLGSVAANIGYAKPHATREQIIAAAVAADAHQFILELPDGYDTDLSAGGQELSGGQRQRLGIARALLADPPILLMDEATASVDTETEVRIQHAIERLVHGRTVVVIAHRLSTLRRAARLYALDGGRVVESGTHDELIRARGYYRRLVQRQREALHVIGVGE